MILFCNPWLPSKARDWAFSTLFLLTLLSSVSTKAGTVLQASVVVDGIGAESSLGAGVGRRISRNGRFVVFESADTDLVPGVIDTNGQLDVFLVDRQSSEITLISHAAGQSLVAGNANSDQAVISADGSWVAFRSTSQDLVSGVNDANFPANSDVFLWSRVSGDVSLVSHSNGDALQTGNQLSRTPTISDDGQFVAFVSQATDLVTQPDMNGTERDVFLFDRDGVAASNVVLVSGVTETGNEASTEAQISGDGNWVVITSDATNLIAGMDNNGTDDVFLWERALAGTPAALSLISHVPGAPTTAGDDRSRSPSISRDGGIIAFDSESQDLLMTPDTNGTTDAFVWRRSTGMISLISHVPADTGTPGNDSSDRAVVSADGSAVVFSSVADDLIGASGTDQNGSQDIFLYDTATEVVSLVSHLPGDPQTTGNNESRRPSISDNGSIVVFLSSSSDLAAGSDNNGIVEDVFQWEEVGSTITLLSHALGLPNDTGNGTSNGAEVSGDGLVSVFSSLANDLLSGATEGLFAADNSADLSLLTGRAPLQNHGGGVLGLSQVQAGRRVSSDDGRWIVFTSDMTNLIDGLENPLGIGNVYLLNTMTGVTRLVSHIPGQPLRTGNSSSGLPEISADGTRIVFTSFATDLVAGAPPIPRQHVYLYEVATDTQNVVTHVPGQPTVLANNSTEQARLSADGARIVIHSRATNITADADLNGFGRDVFLYDVASDSMQRVTNSAVGESTEPVINTDGSRVAFISTASDLVVGSDTNNASDVYVFDQVTSMIQLASHTTVDAGNAGNGAASQPSISGDGRFTVFASSADDMLAMPDANGSQRDVFLFDSQTGAVSLVSHIPGNPAVTGDLRSEFPRVSRDGTSVVFESVARNLTSAADPAGFLDVFAYDTATGVIELVSQAQGGGFPNQNSRRPEVNNDGQWITFESQAQDLTTEIDANGFLTDVFLFDRAVGTTILVSRRFDNLSTSNGSSFRQSVSGDGGTVVFNSRGTDLMSMADSAVVRDDVFIFQRTPNATDLDLSVTPDATEVDPGSTLNLQVIASNTAGNSAVRPVVVLDLPRGTTFQGFSGMSWQCVEYDSVVVCNPDNPLAGAAPALSIDLIMPVDNGPWDIRSSVKSLLQESDPTDNFVNLTIVSPTIFNNGFEAIARSPVTN